MHAQKLRLLLFSVISLIGIFMPWATLNGKPTKELTAVFILAMAAVFVIKIVFIVAVLLAIILGAVGNKAKPLGITKSIFTTIFGLFIGLLAIKYVGDFGTQKILNPGFGLYIMAFGGIMMAVVSLVPTKILPPCLMHKFIAPPKDAAAPVAETPAPAAAAPTAEETTEEA